jgi:MFS family permease
MWVTVGALGLTQIFAWGSTYYLPAILAEPVTADTGWPIQWVVGGRSLGLLVAGLISPWVGQTIQRHGGRPVLSISSIVLGLGLLCLAASPNFLTFGILGSTVLMRVPPPMAELFSAVNMRYENQTSSWYPGACAFWPGSKRTSGALNTALNNLVL